MKQVTLFINLIFLTGYIFSQDVKTLEPSLGKELDFSPKVQREWELRDSLLDALTAGRINWDDLSDEENHLFDKYSETYENMWDIIGGGDSWYDFGGPKTVTASSYLTSQGDNNYVPENAHDLSYKTAWVEGVPGYGSGEFLLYRFAPECPRVNTIIVVDGYVKSKAVWENNSRVKKLKMYINDELYAILNLKDVRAEQIFTVEPIGYADRDDFDKLRTKPEWTIKFEILDVYKGLKYDDVVITEIYFDGLDVY